MKSIGGSYKIVYKSGKQILINNIILGADRMSKKYVLIGTGGRAEFFYGAMVEDYRETCQLVAFCDVNQTRMDYSNRLLEEKYDHPQIHYLFG